MILKYQNSTLFCYAYATGHKTAVLTFGLGDFNAEPHTRHGHLLNLFSISDSFTLHIHEPTRITVNSANNNCFSFFKRYQSYFTEAVRVYAW